jgi:hypothetical protein
LTSGRLNANVAPLPSALFSQLKEAYKNAQNHSSDSSTSIPTVRAQDRNPMTADAIEKTPSSVAKNR